MDLDDLLLSLINSETTAIKLNEVSKSDDLEEDDNDITESLKTEENVLNCVYRIQSNSLLVTKFFLENRGDFRFTPKKRVKLLDLARSVIEDSLILLYIGGVDIPEVEDIEEFANTFELDIQHDGILACATISRAIADLLLSYYDGEEHISYEDFEQYVVEVIAAASLISNRLNSNLREVISKMYS